MVWNICRLKKFIAWLLFFLIFIFFKLFFWLNFIEVWFLLFGFIFLAQKPKESCIWIDYGRVIIRTLATDELIVFFKHFFTSIDIEKLPDGELLFLVLFTIKVVINKFFHDKITITNESNASNRTMDRRVEIGLQQWVQLKSVKIICSPGLEIDLRSLVLSVCASQREVFFIVTQHQSHVIDVGILVGNRVVDSLLHILDQCTFRRYVP